MESAPNPYSPPTANVEQSLGKVVSPIHVYTPFQVELAAFLGGPIAAVYALSRNYSQYKKEKACSDTILFGSIVILFLIWLSAILPPQASRPGITVLCAFGAGAISKSTQLTKSQIADSDQYVRYSAWNVLLLIVLSIISIVAIYIPCYMLLEYLGVVSAA